MVGSGGKKVDDRVFVGPGAEVGVSHGIDSRSSTCDRMIQAVWRRKRPANAVFLFNTVRGSASRH